MREDWECNAYLFDTLSSIGDSLTCPGGVGAGRERGVRRGGGGEGEGEEGARHKEDRRKADQGANVGQLELKA